MLSRQRGLLASAKVTFGGSGWMLFVSFASYHLPPTLFSCKLVRLALQCKHRIYIFEANTKPRNRMSQNSKAAVRKKIVDNQQYR